MNILKTFLPLFILFSACHSLKKMQREYESENLKISTLTENAFVHITYLDSPDFGKVACNGMIYTNGAEAIIFDTPSKAAASEELIDLIENKWKKKIIAIVVNHFHVDCLGGLDVFHNHGIPSYANNLTLQLAEEVGNFVPQNGFDDLLVLNIGNKKVENKFIGEGHTRDNIVSYLPNEKVLFGGCMIKEMNAGKGNLADANISEWSKTAEKVKQYFPEIIYVIPGHGKCGGKELLDYTAQLFEEKK